MRDQNIRDVAARLDRAVRMSRRLEALEEQVLRRAPEGSPNVRRRIKEHLVRIAELRRGDATVENNAELKAVNEALDRRAAVVRGEG